MLIFKDFVIMIKAVKRGIVDYSQYIDLEVKAPIFVPV